MDRSELVAFMRAQPWAVEASVNVDHLPQAAVIGVVVTDEGDLFFDTSKSSRKYKNLIENPSIALVLGWDSGCTVQIEGIAIEPPPEAEDLPRLKELYFARFPNGKAREALPDIAYFYVQSEWARFSDFRQAPPRIEEIRLRPDLADIISEIAPGKVARILSISDGVIDIEGDLPREPLTDEEEAALRARFGIDASDDDVEYDDADDPVPESYAAEVLCMAYRSAPTPELERRLWHLARHTPHEYVLHEVAKAVIGKPTEQMFLELIAERTSGFLHAEMTMRLKDLSVTDLARDLVEAGVVAQASLEAAKIVESDAEGPNPYRALQLFFGSSLVRAEEVSALIALCNQCLDATSEQRRLVEIADGFVLLTHEAAFRPIAEKFGFIVHRQS